MPGDSPRRQTPEEYVPGPQMTSGDDHWDPGVPGDVVNGLQATDLNDLHVEIALNPRGAARDVLRLREEVRLLRGASPAWVRFQEAVRDHVEENWPRESVNEAGLALAEESGEVCRALLKRIHGTRGTPDQWTQKVREECGDVVIVLLDIAAREGFSLVDAVEERWAEVSRRDPDHDPLPDWTEECLCEHDRASHGSDEGRCGVGEDGAECPCEMFQRSSLPMDALADLTGDERETLEVERVIREEEDLVVGHLAEEEDGWAHGGD